MAGPGNGIPDADRERVIETLKVAFVQERLTMEELDARIGAALGARSGAELAVLTADLPGGLAALPPLAREARLSKEVRDGLRVIGSLYLIAAILWLSAVLAGYDTVGAAVSFTAVMTTMVALFSSLHGATVLVHARRRARSGRDGQTRDPFGHNLPHDLGGATVDPARHPMRNASSTAALSGASPASCPLLPL